MQGNSKLLQRPSCMEDDIRIQQWLHNILNDLGVSFRYTQS
jgi:hypothetical protein